MMSINDSDNNKMLSTRNGFKQLIYIFAFFILICSIALSVIGFIKYSYKKPFGYIAIEFLFNLPLLLIISFVVVSIILRIRDYHFRKMLYSGEYEKILNQSQIVLRKLERKKRDIYFDGFTGYWGNRAIYAAISAFALGKDEQFICYLNSIGVPGWEHYKPAWIYILKSIRGEVNGIMNQNETTEQDSHLSVIVDLVNKRNLGVLNEQEQEQCKRIVSIPRLRNWLLQTE